jgi:hypothetical protein
MKVAKIKNGIVVNLEEVSEEWFLENNSNDEYVYVETGELETCQRQGLPRARNVAHIGLRWSPEIGFEQPKYDEGYLEEVLSYKDNVEGD